MDATVAVGENNGATEGPWVLPEGWCWVELREVGNWTSGGTPKSNEPDYYDGPIAWFRITELNEGRLRKAEKTLTQRGLNESSAKIIQAPFLMFAMYGASIGKMAISEIDAATNQAIACCVPFKAVAIDYLFWALQRSKRSIIALGQGGAQPNISQRILLECKIPLAPFAEQRRIVARVDALFGEISEGEAAVTEARKGLDAFRRALLKAAVTGELTRDWREANPVTITGHDILALIANTRAVKGRRQRNFDAQPLDTTALPALPKSWAWARPSEIQAEIANALTIGPFGSNLKVSDYREHGVPLIFVRHIRSEDFRGSNPKFVTKSKAHELASHTARAGDILITKMGDPPGDACRYPDDAPDAIITADCIKWTIHDQVPFPDFYVHFINSAAGRSQMLEKTTGVAQQKVSLDRFRQIIVPVPPPAEAAEILRRVSDALTAAADMLAMLDAEAADAARLKQSILKAAFEGHLVPQDPADEPARAFLARVAASTPSPKRVRARKSAS